MAIPETPEVWLRGPLPGVPALLQPVGHALLQAREEVTAALVDFPEKNLWNRPADVASVGFHLQHLTGVLDRLFTYAHGRALSTDQLDALALEGKGSESMQTLMNNFHAQVDRALEQLRATPDQILTETRGVGRAQLPSTVVGILFHAAEHTQRHVGQLLVTARVA